MGGAHSYNDLKSVAVEYVDHTKLILVVMTYLKCRRMVKLTAILILKILQEIGISNLDPMGSERVHIEVSAKIAYKARNNFIGDPNFYGLIITSFFLKKI